MRPDITDNKAWCNEQTDRLLGYEVLRKTISGKHDKLGALELANKTGSDYLEASRIFNQKFLPRLFALLNRQPSKANVKIIRKLFNEIHH